MKILIIGMLGSGKSTLAYDIHRRFSLPRLNLDETSKDKESGEHYPREVQFQRMDAFTARHESWVGEGCQKYLYERLIPDLIVYTRIPRMIAAWRFTLRFFKAARLKGKAIDPDLPVQAYHYRKPTLSKIRSWDASNVTIRKDVEDFLSNRPHMIVSTAAEKENLMQLIAKGFEQGRAA